MGLVAVVVVVLMFAGAARCDFAKDRDECANTLAGLATCLTYVQGGAGTPTPDCCAGLKGVLAKSPKCLCVLIRDRNDPSLGVQINLTRALTLPDTCKAAANISHCPELLNLPPNSPDAKVFRNLTASTTEGSSGSDNGRSGSTTGHESSNVRPQHSYHFIGGKWLVGMEPLFIALLLLAII